MSYTGVGPANSALVSSGTANSFTINPSMAGSLTATTNLATTSGNLDLPTTNSGGTAGTININNSLFFSNLNNNNFFGFGSGNSALSTATRNVCIGDVSFTQVNTSTDCIALGRAALQFTINGNNHIALGNGSLNTITNGAANIAIGYGSAILLDNGEFNICIGFSSGSSLSSAGESSNILINHPGVTSESNAIRIGTAGSGAGQQNACYIAGIYGVTVGGSGIPVVVDSSGNLGTVVSSRKLKENINYNIDSSRVLGLKPATFNFKSDEAKTKHFGFIAEEVHEVMPDLVAYDDNKQPFSVQYHELPVILLSEIQKLTKRLEILERKA